jgi:hypothetical protein
MHRGQAASPRARGNGITRYRTRRRRAGLPPTTRDLGRKPALPVRCAPDHALPLRYEAIVAAAANREIYGRRTLRPGDLAGGLRRCRHRYRSCPRTTVLVARTSGKPGGTRPNGGTQMDKRKRAEIEQAKSNERRMAERGYEASARTPRTRTPSAARPTTRCEPLHRVPESAALRPDPICIGANQYWRSGVSNLSLADALRRRPRRHHRPHPHIGRDVAGLTIRSSMAGASALRVTSSLRPSASREPSSSQRVSPSP